MINNILFRLPLPLKIFLGRSKTLVNTKKIKALLTVDKYDESSFIGINQKEYRINLKKILSASAYSAEETEDYVKWLYTDKIDLISQGHMDYHLPTIICVVKNEAGKLKNFFKHYSKIGKFNYVFIDNGSSDNSIDIMKSYYATIYQCLEPFSTNRKLAWINKIYTTISNGSWTILLDADELLVYEGYEDTPFNNVLNVFDSNRINTAAAVMVDMFSKTRVENAEYIDKYIFFENDFHEERSFYFNSIYGGIREREFKFGKDRIFLIKKHPIVKKDQNSMLIHCHYIYPFKRNFEAELYFALLHYKLFDSEIEKYKKIAAEGSYGDGSIEYKTYINIFKNKSYEEIFKSSNNTVQYSGTPSLKRITCLHDVGELMK